ncbi:MAG TPA: galactokinase [Pyrinomonadaceae bacterium]|nr:galactokinase [Pyrinomonadaceae bacterium]
MVDLDELRTVFASVYGEGGEPRLFSAPGRVNLIGEHTDYNDGFVLPMAIDRETVVAARPRDDRRLRVYSLNLGELKEFDLDEPGVPQRGIWLDYVEGVARVLESHGALLGGADLAVLSDVPVGAGLSSSAALELSTALALVSLSGAKVERVALALAGQEAEHTFVGTKCGIMDQLVAALGRRGQALLIDCRSLEVEAIPMNMGDVAVAVCDSRVKHELSSSEYNKRRAECERGVELLREMLPGIRALRDVGVAEFELYETQLPEPIRRRCRHVVTENARTVRAAEALRSGRLEEMGRLMTRSHLSLRDDYEVSCRELDALVDIASGVEGVLGARMTGGGFGGCTVNLVRRDALEKFREVVSREYTKATDYKTDIYVVEASDGAKERERRDEG